MNEAIKGVGLVIAGVIVGLLLSSVISSGGNFGGIYSNVQKDFSEGVSVDGTVVINGSGKLVAPITSTTGTFSSTLAVTGATTLGGDIVVTTSNTATSTLTVGCIQMYATSTETALRLEFNTTNSTSTINGDSSGLVAWTYGSCPI